MEYIVSPLMAEGLALREAVLSCQHMELRNLRFESDSAQLIKSLTTGDPIAELISVVSDIRNLAAELESISFVWIPRERNVEADRLAKSVLSLYEPVVVEEEFNAPN
ncbi:hypothetical protein Bca4012_052052 [Brassica carinata]